MGGLSTQMRRLELISDNIANAEKVPGKDGAVYKRKVLVSENENKPQLRFNDEMKMRMRRTDDDHFEPVGRSKAAAKEKAEYQMIEQDGEQMIYEPNHPMADENGYVRKPDVNLVEEMVDLISATRVYEANVTVMNAAKNIAKKSLEI